MAKKEKTIEVTANSGFYGKPKGKIYDQTKLKSIQKAGRELYVKKPNSLEDLGFEKLVVMPFRERVYKNPEPKLVYKVKYDDETDELYLQTGLYIGFLNINGVRIEINTGYNDVLLQRMLNIYNNIYVNTKQDELKDKNSKSNNLSTILGFLFLTSFKAAFAMGLPSEYKTIHERGFNVKGKFDVKKYIQKDMFSDGKLSYSYRQREYVQDIIDVLYLAMEKLSDFEIGERVRYYCELKTLYSGRKVTRETLRRIDRHRSLNNPMYSRYKDALKFARLIIEYKEVIPNDDDSPEGFSGFLADVSQLWEVYLEKVLKTHFENTDYVVKEQEGITLYKGCFYERNNYPDLVIERDGIPIAVLDAKFKTMEYRNKYENPYGSGDVDRDDLFQIQSYAGYYNEKYKDAPLKFCSLVYPAKRKPPDGVKTDSALYGLDPSETSTQFSVGYIIIEDKPQFDIDALIAAEKDFLKRIDELLGIPVKE